MAASPRGCTVVDLPRPPAWLDESAAQSEIQGDEYAVLTEVAGNEALPGCQPVAPAARWIDSARQP